jgi:hypothetical protein
VKPILQVDTSTCWKCSRRVGTNVIEFLCLPHMFPLFFFLIFIIVDLFFFRALSVDVAILSVGNTDILTHTTGSIIYISSLSSLNNLPLFKLKIILIKFF